MAEHNQSKKLSMDSNGESLEPPKPLNLSDIDNMVKVEATIKIALP